MVQEGRRPAPRRHLHLNAVGMAGQPIKLRFSLVNTDLYSYWVM
jgi:hypothetical protein